MRETSNDGKAKKAVPISTAVRDNKTERHSMRMYKDDYDALVYWAGRFEMDRTEFLIAGMHHYIKWLNHDYDLPPAEIQRLNQLTDAIQNLVVNQANIERIIVNGFDSMLGIIRGDNYLVEKEDGSLHA